MHDECGRSIDRFYSIDFFSECVMLTTFSKAASSSLSFGWVVNPFPGIRRHLFRDVPAGILPVHVPFEMGWLTRACTAVALFSIQLSLATINLISL